MLPFLLVLALVQQPTIEHILDRPFDDPSVQLILAMYTTEPPEHVGFIEDRDYRVWKKDGLEMICNRQGVITDIYLYPAFTGPMPGGLTFRDTRAGAAKLFGTPGCTGDANHDFDIFLLEDLALHVEYNDGEITAVTLMSRLDRTYCH